MDRPQKGEGFPGQRIVVLPRQVVARARGHPLLRGLLPTDVGYFPKAAGHLRERALGAEQAIFIYCTQGAGWCDLAGRRHAVAPGELLVIPPEAPHAYGADAQHPWTIFWFHATGAHVPPYTDELGVTCERPVLYLGDATQLRALFEEVLEALERDYAPVQLLYASQALAHLLATMIWQRHLEWRGEPEAEQKIAQSIQFMKQHLAKPIQLPTLAALANLSISHYRALFKQQTGYAPIDYFIRLRLHLACQWLDTTDLSVKEIATRLGYDDPYYFSRIFRSINETSPSQYRQLHKG